MPILRIQQTPSSFTPTCQYTLHKLWVGARRACPFCTGIGAVQLGLSAPNVTIAQPAQPPDTLGGEHTRAVQRPRVQQRPVAAGPVTRGCQGIPGLSRQYAAQRRVFGGLFCVSSAYGMLRVHFAATARRPVSSRRWTRQEPATPSLVTMRVASLSVDEGGRL